MANYLLRELAGCHVQHSYGFVVLRADRSLQSSSRPPSSRAFLVGHRKVYSVRCEADVVMTSVTEVPEPTTQVSRDLLDHLWQANATGSTCLFSNPLLEASDGLGGDSPPRFSFTREAESEKLSVPRSSHGALRLIHLELEAVRNEVRNALHHSLSGS